MVIIDEAVRQENIEFVTVLEEMQDRYMSFSFDEAIQQQDFMILYPKEQALFIKNALHIMPRWKDFVPVTVQYLQDLNKPCAVLKAQHKSNCKWNHCHKDGNIPKQTAY